MVDTFVQPIISTNGLRRAKQMLVHDERVVALYRRIEDLADPHRLARRGYNLVMPDTPRNQILLVKA
jgi:hypothetical protein